MNPQRLRFIDEVIKAVRLDAGEYTIQAIDNMTAHVKEEQYSGFLEKIAEGLEYARPLEIIKSVSSRFLKDIKSELFKNVEAEAKEMERKMENKFALVETAFSATKGHKDLIKRWETPRKFINAAKIDENYWNDKEAFLIKRIGFIALYDIYKAPYRNLWERIEWEMEIILTDKYINCGKKKVENKGNQAILQLAQKKGMAK